MALYNFQAGLREGAPTLVFAYIFPGAGSCQEVRMRDGDFPSVPGPTRALARPALIPQLLFGSRPQSCQSLLLFAASVTVP